MSCVYTCIKHVSNQTWFFFFTNSSPSLCVEWFLHHNWTVLWKTLQDWKSYTKLLKEYNWLLWQYSSSLTWHNSFWTVSKKLICQMQWDQVNKEGGCWPETDLGKKSSSILVCGTVYQLILPSSWVFSFAFCELSQLLQSAEVVRIVTRKKEAKTNEVSSLGTYAIDQWSHSVSG